MKNWLKEIGNKVITNIVVGIVFTVIALITPITRNFLKLYWKQVLILVTLIIIVYFVFYLFKKLRKITLDIITLKADLYDIKNKKILPQNNLGDLKRINETLLTMADDIYDLKRSDLYRKAKMHQDLNQRGSLLCRLKVIDLDIKVGYEFNLEESLEELFEYIKKQTSFSTQDLSDVKNSLNKITNDGHKEVVEQILSQIKSKI